MAFRIARRAALAAASVTVAAAGLLATGGPASATALPTDGRAAVVSHPVRLVDTHDEVRHGSWVEGRDSYDDGRGRWVSDQIEWMRSHDGVSHRPSDDDSRRRWVSDQIEWMRDHHGAHHWVSEHEGRSHR
ncbi:hypothetical protein ACFU8W_21185 [Streptomyces sp. NPDC057565]|uniref:hypothetical protein n=1 Tax=Streptomyces sp. NPDC057565 TaxID=3346169 RepID=UPI00369E3A8E